MKTIKIAIPGGKPVSGLLEQPRGARACYVLAHGAGAGMKHPFMAAVAAGLARRRLATLRYNFSYRERRSRSPDKPEAAYAAVRAAVKAAARTKLPLFAGGKSFGGRMTSQAQAEGPLTGVLGLPGTSVSPIVPIILKDEARALAASRELEARGFLVSAIRPPTVPVGTARLRVTLSAAHSAAQVDALLAALLEIIP